jgi:choline kinase
MSKGISQKSNQPIIKSMIKKAIILAAGVASRLRPLTSETPKCLLHVGKKSILEQLLKNLAVVGVEEAMIVTGFERKKIRDAVRTMTDRPRVRFAHNPYFGKTNNLYSLLLAKSFLINNHGVISDAFMLLDSDISFLPDLLTAFLSHPGENRIAVRVVGLHDEEEMRVQVDAQGRITRISKTIPLDRIYGESIGIETFSAETSRRLFEILEYRIRAAKGRTEFYEAAFQQLIDEGRELTAVDIGEHPVIEVDTVEDLERANRNASAWPS